LNNASFGEKMLQSQNNNNLPLPDIRGFDGLQRRYLPGGEGLETELMMKQLGHQQEHHQDLNQFNSNHRNQEDEDQEPRYLGRDRMTPPESPGMGGPVDHPDQDSHDQGLNGGRVEDLSLMPSGIKNESSTEH